MLRRLIASDAAPAWALALLLLAVVGPLVPINSAQPAVRAAQTGALVEQGSVRLDAFRDAVLVDRVELDGHLYSDKAPLQPLLAAPVYAAGRLVGMESAAVPRDRMNLTQWWLRLATSVLPAVGLVLLMHRTARRVAPAGATLATAACAFGTLLLPFASELYAHVLCTFFGFAAWVVLSEGRAAGRLGLRRAVGAGALAGAAVATEYPTALVVLVLAGTFVVAREWRPLVAFAAGGIPFAALLGTYQQLAFGDPFTTSYSLKPDHAAASPAITGLPRPAQLVEVLMGSRGLVLFSPVVAVGLVGLVRLARRAGPHRAHGAVGLLVFAAFWMLQGGWPNPWGGETPGPRYMITALPFLAVGIAQVITLLPVRLRAVVVGWSVLFMLSPLLAFHMVPDGGAVGLSHLDNVRRFGVTPTAWNAVLGPWGWGVWLLGIAAAGLVVAWTVRARPDREATDRGRPASTVAPLPPQVVAAHG